MFPDELLYNQLARALRQIDFTRVVMDGMLAFLLFAGAINLNLRLLRNRAWQIAFLALIGTALSTLLVGGLFWWSAGLVGTADLPAVGARLRRAHQPEIRSPCSTC